MKKTKKIAISGIAAAFSTVFIIFGNYMNVLDYSFYLLASISVLAVFITEDIIWPVLTFISSCVLGMIFAPNIMVMYPYFMFFAPYVLILGISKLKIKKEYISYIIKEIFYVISICVMYFFTTFFVEINEWNLNLYILLIGALLFMNVYDFLMQNIYKSMTRILKRFLKKG